MLNLSGVGQLGHLHLDVHHVPLSLATNYIGINLCKSCTCFDKLGGSCQKSCCSRPVGTRVLSVMSRMSRLRMQRWASNSFPLVVNTYSQKNWFCIGVIHLGTQILYIYIYTYIYRWVIDVINQWMSGYPVGHLGSKKWLGELLNCVLPRFGAVLMTTRAQRNASNVVNLAANVESPICGNWTLKKVLKRKEHHHLYIYMYIYAYIRLPKMTVLFVWRIPSCQKCHGTLDHPLI